MARVSYEKNIHSSCENDDEHERVSSKLVFASVIILFFDLARALPSTAAC